MMLKLKLQYSGHLMRRVDSLERLDVGSDWGQEEKGTIEDEMAGWHHWLDGCESEWTLGVCDGQGGLVNCDSWGRKEVDTTEQLNWTELITKEDGSTGEHQLNISVVLHRKLKKKKNKHHHRILFLKCVWDDLINSNRIPSKVRIIINRVCHRHTLLKNLSMYHTLMVVNTIRFYIWDLLRE